MSQYDEIVRLVRLGRRAEKRGQALHGCITRILFRAFVILLDGWLLMLVVGMLHDEWWSGLPTIGYRWAIITVAGLQGVFSRVPPTAAKPSGGASS